MLFGFRNLFFRLTVTSNLDFHGKIVMHKQHKFDATSED